jgi:hypothetical protein
MRFYRAPGIPIHIHELELRLASFGVLVMRLMNMVSGSLDIWQRMRSIVLQGRRSLQHKLRIRLSNMMNRTGIGTIVFVSGLSMIVNACNYLLVHVDTCWCFGYGLNGAVFNGHEWIEFLCFSCSCLTCSGTT